MSYLFILLSSITPNTDPCIEHADLIGMLMYGHQTQVDMKLAQDVLVEQFDNPQPYLNYIQKVKITPRYSDIDRQEIAVLAITNKSYEECKNVSSKDL